jgi:hypothetical protein
MDTTAVTQEHVHDAEDIPDPGLEALAIDRVSGVQEIRGGSWSRTRDTRGSVQPARAQRLTSCPEIAMLRNIYRVSSRLAQDLRGLLRVVSPRDFAEYGLALASHDARAASTRQPDAGGYQRAQADVRYRVGGVRVRLARDSLSGIREMYARGVTSRSPSASSPTRDGQSTLA